MVALSRASLQNVLQAEPPKGWAALPVELLVFVFNKLPLHSQLQRCACVCKAWQAGAAEASRPQLVLHTCHANLRQLITLTPSQRATVGNVQLIFSGGPEYATASTMTLAIISGTFTRLQYLMFEWCDIPIAEDGDWKDVGCSADS